jgi:hypothetical protein
MADHQSQTAVETRVEHEHADLRVCGAVFSLSELAAWDGLRIGEQSGRKVDDDVLRVAHRHERVIRTDFFGRELHGARQGTRVAGGLVEEVRFVQGLVDRAWFGGFAA